MIEKGYIICYERREDLAETGKARMTRELFGYEDKSFYGKYRYQREGLLSKISYYSPVRSVLVVRKEDGPMVLKYLKKKTKVCYWEITLNQEDKKKLHKERIGGWHAERKERKRKGEHIL